ncbi:transcription initiation factor TFIID subunit 8 [Scaptodrosophila lebanonensis]|uniref:Transcription initiation factor TFIID subunit 8 n=1 Tax=Drosophila lebanonensis TaxID=7225 RepID=A0A6J2TA96_DROLE|nr:transcription initiation factor TFIID subunit 8 [Scaptodrosophila lebanonensis]
MLKERDCIEENKMVRYTLLDSLRNKIITIAQITSSNAIHANRCVPSYFDLERTFKHMRIDAKDLEPIRYGKEPEISQIEVQETQMREEDFFKESPVMLGSRLERDSNTDIHIPEHIPPFPSEHTYKETTVVKQIHRDFVSVRERHSTNQEYINNALNSFYLRTQPTTSLYPKKQHDMRHLLVAAQPPKKPAFLDALRPCSQLFEMDIYESEGQTQASLLSPFSNIPIRNSVTVNTPFPEPDVLPCKRKATKRKMQDNLEELDWSMPD